MRHAVCFAALCSAVTATAAPPDPVFAWEFAQGNFGRGTIQPTHGALAGTFAGAPELLRHEGLDALLLDGRSDHVVITAEPDDLALLPTTGLTVAAWVAVNAPQRWGGIAGCIQDNGDEEQGWLLGFQDDRFSWALASTGADDGNGALTYLAGGPAFIPGRWYHVAGTFDGAAMRLYVDGVEVAVSEAQTEEVLLPVRGVLALGAYRDDNESYVMQGRLGAVAIYDVGLGADDVRLLFEAESARTAHAPYIDTRLRFVVEPYLQRVTQNEISVVWETTRPASPWVEFGSAVPLTERRSVEAAGTLHTMRLDGLEAGRTYFYRVGSDDDLGQRLTGELRSFQTAVEFDTPYTFVVIGDTQSQPTVVERVARQAWGLRPHFILHAGDLVSTGSNKTDWTGHFFPNMQPLIGRVPFFPVLGNHEQDAGFYYDYMDLPAPEFHYTFDYGNAQFFMLDTNKSVAPGSPQYAWLEEELAACDATWKVVVHHQPVYTSDSDDYGDTYREAGFQGDRNARQLTALYDAHGVDLVFNGHIHLYERTFPIRSGRAVRSGGTTYITTGGGGGGLEAFAPTKPWFSALTRVTHHFCYVTVNGESLTVRTYDDEGRLFDQVELDAARQADPGPASDAAAVPAGGLLGMLAAGAPSADEPPGAPAPLAPVPSARQLSWHDRQYYAFVHFGVNTFTDREWGTGAESPAVFAPSALDCRQWARVCRDAGMTGIILTAKHHDGFCLWPSAQTEHTVAASPWRDGSGDVLADLAAACAEFDLWLGVYVSPWDRHEPTYGDSAVYNRHFMAQLEEVLTGYGPVAEVWFDGACGEGPNGKRQEYDWEAFVATVRRCAPDAVIFSDAGPDVRWVGNERGYAGETNWGGLSPADLAPGHAPAERLNRGERDGTHWIPAECNTSIRPGWFYHPAQDDHVKPLAELVRVWEGSVGRGGNLLLNLPVDTRGLVHDHDVERLMELRDVLDRTYGTDLFDLGGEIDAWPTRNGGFAPMHLRDHDPRTYWAAPDGATEAYLRFRPLRPIVIDRIRLAEHLPLGQRIERFIVEARTDGATGWRTLAEGTTVGRRRIVTFPPVRVHDIRVKIEEARACPAVTMFEAHLAPPEVLIEAPEALYAEAATVRLACAVPGAVIRYTLDGSVPDGDSPRYDAPIILERSATVTARAWSGQSAGSIATHAFRRLEAPDLRPGVQLLRRPDPGFTWRAFEGRRQSLDDFDPRAAPAAEGKTDRLDASSRTRDEQITLHYQGCLEVPTPGLYRFFLTSDDGSRLVVSDVLVVDHDGLHGMDERSGAVGLAAGFHLFDLRWFNATGGLGLRVEVEGPGIERQLLATSPLAIRAAP